MPYKDKEKHLEVIRAWQRRRSEEIRKLLEAAKNVPCVDCGKQYHPCCMEFDHVRGDKKFKLSSAASNRWSQKDILAEIAKCEVRCVICHRMRHLSDASGSGTLI